MQETSVAREPDARTAAPWPWHRRLLVHYLRHEWPAWGRLYRLLGGERDAAWAAAGVQRVRGKLHGYTMPLDLGNWSERLSWCLARYHDLPLQVLLQRLVRDGDCFVDVGANIGMVTLLARRLVGDRGRVFACEPNPRLAGRLHGLVQENGLTGVRVVQSALGERPGVLQLREFGGHSGWGTLAAVGPEGTEVTSVADVPVVVGDELLAEVPAAMPMVMKIDVEGFEVPVLRGLRRTLQRGALVVIEIGEQHQRRAGFSGAELRRAFTEHGYIGYVLDYRRRGLWRGGRLRPLLEVEPHEVDALFVPPGELGRQRLGDWLPR